MSDQDIKVQNSQNTTPPTSNSPNGYIHTFSRNARLISDDPIVQKAVSPWSSHVSKIDRNGKQTHSFPPHACSKEVIYVAKTTRAKQKRAYLSIPDIIYSDDDFAKIKTKPVYVKQFQPVLVNHNPGSSLWYIGRLTGAMYREFDYVKKHLPTLTKKIDAPTTAAQSFLSELEESSFFDNDSSKSPLPEHSFGPPSVEPPRPAPLANEVKSLSQAHAAGITTSAPPRYANSAPRASVCDSGGSVGRPRLKTKEPIGSVRSPGQPAKRVKNNNSTGGGGVNGNVANGVTGFSVIQDSFAEGFSSDSYSSNYLPADNSMYVGYDPYQTPTTDQYVSNYSAPGSNLILPVEFNNVPDISPIEIVTFTNGDSSSTYPASSTADCLENGTHQTTNGYTLNEDNSRSLNSNS